MFTGVYVFDQSDGRFWRVRPDFPHDTSPPFVRVQNPLPDPSQWVKFFGNQVGLWGIKQVGAIAGDYDLYRLSPTNPPMEIQPHLQGVGRVGRIPNIQFSDGRLIGAGITESGVIYVVRASTTRGGAPFQFYGTIARISPRTVLSNTTLSVEFVSSFHLDGAFFHIQEDGVRIPTGFPICAVLGSNLYLIHHTSLTTGIPLQARSRVVRLPLASWPQRPYPAFSLPATYPVWSQDVFAWGGDLYAIASNPLIGPSHSDVDVWRIDPSTLIGVHEDNIPEDITSPRLGTVFPYGSYTIGERPAQLKGSISPPNEIALPPSSFTSPAPSCLLYTSPSPRD